MNKKRLTSNSSQTPHSLTLSFNPYTPATNKNADESPKVEQKTAVVTDPATEQSNIIPNPIDPIQKLPVRRYLDQTIVPILLAGMTELVKERYISPTFYVYFRLS